MTDYYIIFNGTKTLYTFDMLDWDSEKLDETFGFDFAWESDDIRVETGCEYAVLVVGVTFDYEVVFDLSFPLFDSDMKIVTSASIRPIMDEREAVMAERAELAKTEAELADCKREIASAEEYIARYMKSATPEHMLVVRKGMQDKKAMLEEKIRDIIRSQPIESVGKSDMADSPSSDPPTH